MFTDSEAIRALAQRTRRLGEELRDEADAVLRAAGAVPWTGVAADAMRFSVRGQVRALRRCAGLHDVAAEALWHHAAEVDRHVALLRSAEHVVGDLVSVIKEAA